MNNLVAARTAGRNTRCIVVFVVVCEGRISGREIPLSDRIHIPRVHGRPLRAAVRRARHLYVVLRITYPYVLLLRIRIRSSWLILIIIFYSRYYWFVQNYDFSEKQHVVLTMLYCSVLSHISQLDVVVLVS